MFKRALTYVVLILVVLQSGIAMGDAHQLHQSGVEHVAFDETHPPHEELESDEHQIEDASSLQEWDCHHCCHCHGHFCPFILVSAERFVLSKGSSPVPDYSENAFPDTVEALLRPPKA